MNYYDLNQYDSSGRVSTQTHSDGGVYRFNYLTNANGVITETDVTDPNGNVRKTTFNAPPSYPDGFTTGGFPATITYAAGTPQQEVFTHQYQPSTNLVTSITDPLNRTTAYTYDNLGNTTSVTALSGTNLSLTTRFTYDPIYSQLTSIVDPIGRLTTFTRDSNGNLTSVTDPLGQSFPYTYDNEGRILTAADPAGDSTSYTYTGADLTAITDPLNRTIMLTPDGAGRTVSSSSPLGHTTTYSYNAFSQLTSTTDPLGGVTSVTYDGDGNVTAITDPEHPNNPTRYGYDPMDQLQTRTDSLGNSESYIYDQNGNVMQFSDRRNKLTTYNYDALNRLTFVGFGSLPGPTYESTIGYTYDLGDRMTQVADSQAGTFSRVYDGLDRMTQEQGPQGTVGYTYDAASRRTQLAVSGQSSPVTYTFDNDDRVTDIAQGSVNVSFTYDSVGRRTSLTLPNGIAMGYGYDQSSQLTGITYSIAGSTLGNLTYLYDQDGRRTQVGGSWGRTALPTPTTSSAVYNVDNQLTNWDGATLNYDANGNLSSDGINNYTWDARNQLASISGGSSASFTYDPFGRRLAKTINGTVTEFLYDGSNPVQELSGATVNANLLAGTKLDEYFSRSDAAGARNFLRDALGSTIALSDTNAGIQTQYTYDPFGNTASQGSTSTNSYQFTGRENDTDGLYFYRARYYEPAVERFISEDPIRFAGSSNFYAYAENRPTNAIDSTGLTIWICSRRGLQEWFPGGIGNHGFLYDTRNGDNCGKGDGNHPHGTDSPSNAGTFCVPVPGSEGLEDKVMKCCRDRSDASFWARHFIFPPYYDCQAMAGDCLAEAGLKNPGFPGGRLGCPGNCRPKLDLGQPIVTQRRFQ